MSKLNIRSMSWLDNSISWAVVIAELGNAFGELGHNFLPVSTNGAEAGMFKQPNILTNALLQLEKLKRTNTPVDLEVTFTVPQNLGSRFLPNSKHKACIYAFEYQFWNMTWKKYYHLADYFFPPSDFAAEVFYNNGIPKEKIFMVPHGVDQEKFNANIPPVKLKTQKAFRFCSVVAPHSRKRIDIMLKAYAEAFTAADDVCLVLKTKMYKKGDPDKKGFEVYVSDYIDELKKKYGDQMPEIEVFDQRIPLVASLYNACHVNVSSTGSECFLIPALECMTCGVKGNMFNIVPNYSGHLQFTNEKNSLLVDGKMVKALTQDQYWCSDNRNKIYQSDQKHMSELMIKSYKEYDTLLEKFKPELIKTANEYSWKNAAQRMIDVCDGKIPHYIPGTVKLPK